MTLGTKKPFEMGNNQMNKGQTNRGAKNINSNMKFQEDDINEAKASLKLLKQKINTTNTINKFSGVSNNLGGLNADLNTNVPNTSHNYRKVFKPAINNDHEAFNKINSQTLKPNNFPSKGVLQGNNDYSAKPHTSSSNANKFNYNTAKPNVESKINKDSINPVFSKPMTKKG
jgi:hypothetical protein